MYGREFGKYGVLVVFVRAGLGSEELYWVAVPKYMLERY